jgi:nucleoside-diphosphate-sugar epimerase
MSINDGRVVTNFIVQALRGEPLTVYGDGSQTRSFCYVDDLISGILKLFFAEGLNEPVNLGNPIPVSMGDLASEIIGMTNSTSEIIFQDLPSDDPKLREPDISKATELLGWTPMVSRHDGLSKTIDYLSTKIRSLDA